VSHPCALHRGLLPPRTWVGLQRDPQLAAHSQALQEADARAAEAESEASSAKAAAGEATAEAAAAQDRAKTLRGNLESIQESYRKVCRGSNDLLCIGDHAPHS